MCPSVLFAFLDCTWTEILIDLSWRQTASDVEVLSLTENYITCSHLLLVGRAVHWPNRNLVCKLDVDVTCTQTCDLLKDCKMQLGPLGAYVSLYSVHLARHLHLLKPGNHKGFRPADNSPTWSTTQSQPPGKNQSEVTSLGWYWHLKITRTGTLLSRPLLWL